MKKIFIVLLSFCIIYVLMCGCSSNTTAAIDSVSVQTADSEISKSTNAKTTGFRMVSDGEFIYYSQYGEQGLRKISVDLSGEVLLADEDCTYLTLAGDTLYYVVPDSGIWQIKTDGSERKQLEMMKDISWLSYDGESLYFIQDYSIYRFDIEEIGETIEELEEEYGAAAAESEASTFFQSEKIIDGSCQSLAASAGKLFYVISSGNNDSLYVMDIDDNTSSLIASDIESDILIDNGRLYFEEVERINDLDENIRICSVNLSGSDRKVIYEGENAGGYFTVNEEYLYFTHYEAHGADNFEGNYMYQMDIASNDIKEFYINYDVSIMLESAGDYVWFDHYSYDTSLTQDYWGKTDGSQLALLDSLHAQTKRSDYLDPYVETYGPGESYLDLTTNNMSACYKLVRMDEIIEFTEFLEPNSQTTISFPSGKYILKIAEGDEWLGDDLAFGESGIYSTTDVYKFDAGYSYEIVGGTTGDFNTDNLNGFLD